mmetsp:Transcript_27618/g.76453  ORF Transcript_27618/g.76453 Transcript_27618/m.76453 type:complete len:237 (+) Transcript_27618:67-777(+)|eukprot:CAMPEP_0117505644 /NCGR_PEP_ID=MMETSP0784-20121206/25490_1 /TAXON_ID=39447 /ORGANISM="" /LENGTH=236 /DNA_ID=CAMNT_0005301075 /DNA_START=66 /DNA_END=776 /DNA_ORIENTATION=+
MERGTSDEWIQEVLELHAKKEFQDEYKLLSQGLQAHENEPRMLWMLARSCFDLSCEAAAQNDKEAAENYVREGLQHAQASVATGADLAPAYKWNAVMLSKLGDFEGLTEKIKNSFVIKELALRAAELDPNDATTQHVLGAWCYNVAKVTWYERKAASMLFASPPTSTYEEAELYLLRSDDIDGTQFENSMLLGDLYVKTGRPHDARTWYQRVLDQPCSSLKEKALHETATKKMGAL